MKHLHACAAAALAVGLATPVFAQGALIGTEAIDDRITDIRTDIRDDLAEGRDAQRFGFGNVPQGPSGSLSLGLNATSGNTDTTDFSTAGRLRYGAGPNQYSIGFGGTYSSVDEDNDDDDGDEVSDGQAFLTLDYLRALDDRNYLFGLGYYQYDDDGPLEHDAFLGGGYGYRFITTPTQTLRAQIGIGARYSKDALRNEETEPAAIASARYFQQITPTISLSDDLDLIYSDEADLAVRNDLGVNFGIGGSSAARVAYVTDYNADAPDGFDNTDNRLKVSLVYGF